MGGITIAYRDARVREFWISLRKQRDTRQMKKRQRIAQEVQP